MHEIMKMTSQKDKNLVHVYRQFSNDDFLANFDEFDSDQMP